MRAKFLNLLIIHCLSFQASWLSAQIQFETTTYDFGVLSNWSQTPAIFEYQNIGNQPEAFLNAIRSDNVHLKYTSSFIKAGEKGQVLIYFEPLQIGHFSEKIKLYVGSSPEPFVFTVSGTVNSNLECPSVNMPADPSLLIHEQRGIVIDSKTKQVIPNAEIWFIDSQGEKFTEKTNKEGRFKKKLKLGMYQIIVSAEDYNSLDDMIYLNMNTPELVFELDPKGELIQKETSIVKEEIEQENKVAEPELKIESEDKLAEGNKIEFIEEESTETELMPFNLNGIVLDEISNLPLNRASVKLVNLESKSPYFYKTFKDGKFSKQLYPGRYYVLVQANDYSVFEDTIIINPEQSYLEIKLKPEIIPDIEIEKVKENLIVGGTIRNRENREPVKRATLIFTDENQVKYSYVTMVDGKFQKTMKSGTYYVSIIAEGFLPYADTIQIDQPTHYLDFFIDFIFVEEEKIALETEEVPEIELSQETEKIPEAANTEFLPPASYAANNIVFLVDVSSSMKKRNKLDNLKTAMKRLTEVLRDIDQVSLITYASGTKTVFTEIPADEKDTILKSIDSLTASGLTYGVRGLERAYIIAEANYIEGGNNQVIVATDGEFNSPDHSEIELIALITKYRQKGIITSVIGFGNDEKALKRMKRMASIGNGNFIQIQDEEQARTVLIEEIKGNSRRQ